MEFKRAVKYEAKGRVALIGPAGSGKSYTMLVLARLLAGPTGRIAAVDTEHGSLSKYADLFEFDTLELDSFSPENFLSALGTAEAAGYVVFCADSLSHFWMGKDGALEFVDNATKTIAAKRQSQKDSFTGWKAFRPHERQMVDAMLASPLHIIVTMRTKTEYVEQINAEGKKQRVKIGLNPVQRDGLEYEFDLVGYMDDENCFITDKSRCPDYTGKAINKPKPADFGPFVKWLAGAATPPLTEHQQLQRIAVGQIPDHSLPDGGSNGHGVTAQDIVPAEIALLWGHMKDVPSVCRVYAELKADIVEVTGAERPYYDILAKHGMTDANDVKDKGRKIVRTCARELYEHLAKCRAALEPPTYQATDTDLPAELGGVE